MDYMQNLSITADIPPEETVLTANATARVWISETRASAGVRRLLEDRFYDPVSVTEILRFTERLSLQHYMVYDPEISAWNIQRTSLSWGALSASFTATRSRGYYLVTHDDDPINFGWFQHTEERLNPQELSIGYQKTHSLIEGSMVTFSGLIDTSLSFNLQQHTESKFSFRLGIEAKINRFLDISLSSLSENTVIFRYFQNTFLFGNQNIDVPGEKNPFIDLINSFRFDDTRRRESSGFKLKSFNLNLVHHLGDWDATLGITLTPVLDRNIRRYRFNNEISFLVQWKPIREFKTDIQFSTDDGLSYE